MYNSRFKYLATNKILSYKQLNFREGDSIEHKITQLIDQIKNSYKKYSVTTGVFIDFLQSIQEC